MKKKLLPWITDLVLVWLLSYGSISCLISGVGLHTGPAFLPLSILLTVFFVACWRSRDGWMVLLAALAVFLLCFAELKWWKSFEKLGLALFTIYGQAYGLSVPGMGPAALAADVTLSLVMVCGLQCLALGFAISRRKPIGWCMPIVLLPVCLSLVVVDTVPAVGSIFLLILGLVLALFTSATRRRSETDGARLVTHLLIPSVLAVSLCLAAVPQDSYEPPELEAIENGPLSFLFNWQTGVTPPDVTLPSIDVTLPIGMDFGLTGLSGDLVPLSSLGSQTQSHQRVMYITSSSSRTVYLRARSYSFYAGTRWSSRQVPEDQLFISQDYLLPAYENLTVRTDRVESNQYLTYYVNSELTLTEGRVPNAEEKKRYDYTYQRLDPAWAQLWRSEYADVTIAEGNFQVDDAYLQLPGGVQDRMQQFLDEMKITPGIDLLVAANRIEAFVENSASYSLSVEKMPDRWDDFAGWFLLEADEGYCVHFATAAVVLLRAAGIPARYVEGYMVPVTRTNEAVPVTRAMAHAWVEYYVPNVGWIPMDPTPGNAGPVPPAPSVPSVPPTTEPIAPTLPPSTDPSTLPPLPTDPSTTPPTTQPSAPSLPAETTVPTLSSTVTDSAGLTVPTENPPPAAVSISIPGWILHLLATLAGIAALLLGQWFLRIRLRLYLLHRGSREQQALACWRYARHLAKITATPVPDYLYHLAQKARYSRQGLSQAELTRFHSYFDSCIRVIGTKNVFLRLIYRFILVVY